MISIKCLSHASKRSTSSTHITKAIVRSNQLRIAAVIKSHQSSTPTTTPRDKLPISHFRATRSLKNNSSWKCHSIQLMSRRGSIIAGQVSKGRVIRVIKQWKRKLTSTIKSASQDSWWMPYPPTFVIKKWKWLDSNMLQNTSSMITRWTKKKWLPT